MYAKKYTDLEIYQISVSLAGERHKTIHSIPKYWEIPESNQIKRSSRSVPANMTEGFGNASTASSLLSI
ncbi:four helix bundle protein [Candidatus Peregrinibacteria bacterium]|nr:MAG: four helix bundle protein [Candidatus Peregrinibacteria bacterium]